MGELKIVEVTTKKQIKDFIELPLNMYKDNPYYIPPIYMDEKALFKKDCIHNLTCDQIFFVAYRNNKPVGRIQGIIQKQYNEIYNTKKARFSRFHCEDNIETATKLFKEVEKWAKEKGMEEVIGPMGYNDLEREGLLIEGFNYLNTYEEEYTRENPHTSPCVSVVSLSITATKGFNIADEVQRFESMDITPRARGTL